jgi:hypothetical protein
MDNSLKYTLLVISKNFNSFITVMLHGYLKTDQHQHLPRSQSYKCTYLTPVYLRIGICRYFSIESLQVLVTDVWPKQLSYGFTELIKSKVFCNRWTMFSLKCIAYYWRARPRISLAWKIGLVGLGLALFTSRLQFAISNDILVGPCSETDPRVSYHGTVESASMCTSGKVAASRSSKETLKPNISPLPKMYSVIYHSKRSLALKIFIMFNIKNNINVTVLIIDNETHWNSNTGIQ